jgi:hypothetical protein
MECDYHMKKCVFCSHGYVLPSKDICYSVKNHVDHCIRYADATTCTLCNLGFYLDIESNSCQKYGKVTTYIKFI